MLRFVSLCFNEVLSKASMMQNITFVILGTKREVVSC